MQHGARLPRRIDDSATAAPEPRELWTDGEAEERLARLLAAITPRTARGPHPS